MYNLDIIVFLLLHTHQQYSLSILDISNTPTCLSSLNETILSGLIPKEVMLVSPMLVQTGSGL